MADEQNKKHPEPELTRKKIVPLKEYGLLKVIQWPDGTIITLNTKKGEENMRIHHASGSYDEITSEGTRIHFSSNNSVSYSKTGMTFTYDSNSDTKAGGHARVSFDHDTHIEVKKNASIVCGGHMDVASLGHLKVAAKGNMYLGTADGKVNISGGKGVEINGQEGRVMIEADGVVYLHSKSGDVHSEAKEDVVMSSGKNNITMANKDITEDAKGNLGSKAKGEYSMHGAQMHAQADSTLNLKGETVKIGGGSAVMVVSGTNLVTPPWVSGGDPPEDAPDIGSGFEG